MTISQLRSQSLRREKEDPLQSVQEHLQLHIKVGHDNSEMRVKGTHRTAQIPVESTAL
jgi:hypothetical protein